MDLMYGFADQTPEMWHRTVEQTVAFQPEYITLYQMRYKGTRLADQASRVSLDQVNLLRAIASDALHAAGYEGTPGKNTYSRIPGDPGTSDYLTERVNAGTPYLGLGLAAQSFSPYTLSYNLGAATKSLTAYLRSVQAGALPVQDLYHLPRSVAMAKMIAVSFYFGQIHRTHLAEKFGVRLEEHFEPEISFLLDHGWMECEDPYLRLTPAGARRFNGIVALFYSGAVQEYLIHLQPKALSAEPTVEKRKAA
jgi:oxygen-independent coproporphyrinogen-3 oxidase